jgi:hypothetical protein
MNDAMIDKIASAVLYEGYMLYPYRPSLKNRQRWTFGGVYPRSYSEAYGGTDAWTIQTQCLVEGNGRTTVEVKVRFLHLMARQVGQLESPMDQWSDGAEPPHQIVPSLQIDETLYHTWQEAVEREIALGSSSLDHLAARGRHQPFHFPSRRETEPLWDSDGKLAGILAREQEPIEGTIELAAEPIEEGLFRVTVRIGNESAMSVDDARRIERDEILMRSLLSTHTVLGLERGQFVSLIDPPDRLRRAAAGCRNVGAWPVLVGEEGQKDTILSAPIILYDYPQVAPESPGDLFDATEIDEILSLRILTMTEDEKLAMAAVDPQTRALLERTETLAGEGLLGLHGTVRGFAPTQEPS